jgi:hypothetical protein
VIVPPPPEVALADEKPAEPVVEAPKVTYTRVGPNGSVEVYEPTTSEVVDRYFPAGG